MATNDDQNRPADTGYDTPADVVEFDTADGLAERAKFASETGCAYPVALQWGADTAGVFPIVTVAAADAAALGGLARLDDPGWEVASFASPGLETLIHFPDDVPEDEARRRVLAAAEEEFPVPDGSELGQVLFRVRTVSARTDGSRHNERHEDHDEQHDGGGRLAVWASEVSLNEVTVCFDAGRDLRLLAHLVTSGRLLLAREGADDAFQVAVPGESLFELLRRHDVWDPSLLTDEPA